MADGGEELLTGTIAGQLSQLLGKSYPVAFRNVRVLHDAKGDYRNVIEVEMASGTYYVSITDYDFGNIIEEEP